MRVLNDQLLVRRSKGEQLSSILATPDVALEKASVGTVLRVGEGHVVQRIEMVEGVPKIVASREPLVPAVGDRVVFTDWGGDALALREKDKAHLAEDLRAALDAGEELFVIPEDYVLAVVQGEGKVSIV